MRLTSALVFVSLVLWFGPWCARADIFKYTDHQGRVYYTDKPKHAGFRLILKSPAPFAAVLRTRRAIGIPGAIKHGSGRKRYAALVNAAASKHGVDANLLHAVIKAESDYNASAISDKGAVGLMQLMPETAERYGVKNRHDPKENIEGGARYLSDLIALFESNVPLAVAAYNAGENNVIKYGNHVPPFPETRSYVVRVMSFFQRLNGSI
jgi:soluble lytic murein transglycosylase-like protein